MLLAITGQSAITGHRRWILRIGKLRPKAGVAAQGHGESGTEVTVLASPHPFLPISLSCPPWKAPRRLFPSTLMCRCLQRPKKQMPGRKVLILG